MYKYIFIFSIFLSLSTQVYSQNNIKPENKKRLALVIGNAEYERSGKLRNTVNDAKSLAAELESLGFEVIIGLNLSQKGMRLKIKEFGSKLAEEKGAGLFFYGGQALQIEGENYLIPINTQIERIVDVEFEAISLKRVMGEMEYAKNYLNFIIIDNYRSNLVQLYASSHYLGLAHVSVPQNTFLMISNPPGNVTHHINSSIFMTALLKNIGLPNQSSHDLFKKVRVDVMKKTNNEQNPWSTSTVSFEFYFNKVD